MKKFRNVSLFLLSLITIFACGCGSESEPVASLESFKGKVEVRESAQASIKKAQEKQKLFNGGSIESDEESSATLQFIKDKTMVKLEQNTHFEIRNFSQKDLKQMSGVAVYQVSPQNTELKIETPHGVATVLGTTFMLDVAATNTALIVEKGKVGFNDGKNQVIVDAGKKFVTGVNTEPAVVDPFDLNELFSPDSGQKKHYNQR